jgi:hypothetical protein
MKKREAVNLALHIGVGAALAAAVMWHPAFIVLATFIYAWLREQAQHRYILTEATERPRSPGDLQLYVVDKRTFFDFGWMTGHRIWEVFQWTIGSAVAVALWTFIA